MAIVRRRCAATAAAWLSFSALALIWLVSWEFDIQLQPSRFRSFTQSDDELQHLFKNLQNTSWSSSSTTCKEFLLEGAAEDPIINVGSRRLGMFEWEGGEWFNPPEALDDARVLPQTFLRGGGELHEAAFSATPNANIEVEWGSLADLVRTFQGRLVLREFWDFYMGGDLGFRDLKLLLHGAFVSTGADLRMKYPKRPSSLATSRVEGELSSARRPGDPLHFPALRIVGSRGLTGSEYEFRLEKFLQTALNMSSSSNLDNNGNASLDGLWSYLEDSGAEYTALVAPTLTEQSQMREHGKVVVGPFSTPYSPRKDGAFLSTIELVLRFNSVVTRRTTTGRVLVTASMMVSLSCCSRNYYAPSEDQQTPFNVEGIWDPVSKELCMIGIEDDEIFPWKLCLKLVLRKRVSIDSALEGAALSGPDFAPLRLLRRGGDRHHLYRYTVAAKAAELAWRVTSPEFEALSDTRWFHPRFPGPSDVPGICRATANLHSTLSRFSECQLHGADGKVMDVSLYGFKVTFMESCGEPHFRGPKFQVPWDTPLKAPVARSYLRVAGRLSLVLMREESFPNFTPWAQNHAEGVYEPFTGKMHLVVHQRQGERIDGVTGQLVAAPWPLVRNGGGDSEIYMRLQFPSVDRTMTSAEEEALDPSPYYSHHGEYGHRFKVNVWVESLRSKSDPLYFRPLVGKTYPNYKPSVSLAVKSSVQESA